MKEIISGIYCIENMVNKKKYIGKARDIDIRFKEHKARLNKKNHDNIHLQGAWDKYGEENFKFYLLQEAPKEQLNLLEIELIEEFNTADPDFGYNKTKGGEGCFGRITSEETRQKLRKINLGRVFSQEWRDKIGKGHKGIVRSKESKLKQSIANIGKKYPKEFGEAIIERKMNIISGNGNNNHVGVSFRNKGESKPWSARIYVKDLKKRIWIGQYKTEREAIEAWENAYFEYYHTKYIQENNESED